MGVSASKIIIDDGTKELTVDGDKKIMTKNIKIESLVELIESNKIETQDALRVFTI